MLQRVLWLPTSMLPCSEKLLWWSCSPHPLVTQESSLSDKCHSDVGSREGSRVLRPEQSLLLQISHVVMLSGGVGVSRLDSATQEFGIQK